MGGLTPAEKQQRRTEAAKHKAYNDADLTWLLKMVKDMTDALKLKGGNPTLAIGYYSPADEIWICSKGAGAKETVKEAADENRPLSKIKSQILLTDTKGGNFENMHAEMQIVNNVVRAHELNYKTQLATKLVIACGPNKPVCMDCCGWMARKNIPHGVTCGERADQGWRHPITKAGFRGDGKDVQYTKLKKKEKDDGKEDMSD